MQYVNIWILVQNSFICNKKKIFKKEKKKDDFIFLKPFLKSFWQH